LVARERERALADARDHLLSLSKALSREQATNEAHARRIADLETQVAQYRQQMAKLAAGATAPTNPDHAEPLRNPRRSDLGAGNHPRRPRSAPSRSVPSATSELEDL
jgi:hypothetical protein